MFLVSVLQNLHIVFITESVKTTECPGLATNIFTMGTLLLVEDFIIMPKFIKKLGFIPVMILELLQMKLSNEIVEKYAWRYLIDLSYRKMPLMIEKYYYEEPEWTQRYIYGPDSNERVYEKYGGVLLSAAALYVVALFYALTAFFIKRLKRMAFKSASYVLDSTLLG